MIPNITLELTDDEAKKLTEVIIAVLYGKALVTDDHFTTIRIIARKLASKGAATERSLQVTQ